MLALAATEALDMLARWYVALQRRLDSLCETTRVLSQSWVFAVYVLRAHTPALVTAAAVPFNFCISFNRKTASK